MRPLATCKRAAAGAEPFTASRTNAHAHENDQGCAHGLEPALIDSAHAPHMRRWFMRLEDAYAMWELEEEGDDTWGGRGGDAGGDGGDDAEF